MPRLSIRSKESKGFYLDLPMHSEVKVSSRNNSKDRLIRGGQRAMRKVVEPLDSNFADGRLTLAELQEGSVDLSASRFGDALGVRDGNG